MLITKQHILMVEERWMRELFSDKEKIVIGIIVIFVIIILLWAGIYILLSGNIRPINGSCFPNMSFSVNGNNLTVSHIEAPSSSDCPDVDLIWDKIRVNGTCEIIPTGTINKGDKITNCTGEVIIIWKPHKTVLWEWNFEE